MKPSEMKSGVTYKCTHTRRHESGGILYPGNKFKISEDKEIVSVYMNGNKKWEEYQFDEVFPDDEPMSIKEV